MIDRYGPNLTCTCWNNGKLTTYSDNQLERRLRPMAGVSSKAAVPAAVADTTSIIKRSLQWRAKYRKGGGPTPYVRPFAVLLVVPHPNNRAGDPVVSLRTRQLGNTLAKDGYDKLEASSAAVAVQETPASKGGGGQWISFQDHYEKSIMKDEYMVKMIDQVPATIGSLSHGHHNCLSRNIYAGMLGCVCGHYGGSSRGDGVASSSRGAGGCTCEANKFFTPEGNYDLEKLKEYEPSWYEHVTNGNEWEILDGAIDVEEPTATTDISVALNKK